MDPDTETLADDDVLADDGEADRLEAEAEKSNFPMDPDTETLADDDVLADDGEADRLEAEAEANLLRDRLRLAVINIATSESKKVGMEISDPVVACIADLTFKSAEQLAKDVELFAQHAGRKSIRMEDVILTAHRNHHLMGMLRTFSQELKGKEPCAGRKRKTSSKKDDTGTEI